METKEQHADLIKALVADTSRGWERQLPAPAEAIAALQANAGWGLPADYLVFLSISNGGNGALGVQPGWFQLWEAENVVPHNEGYGGEEDFYAPFFGFGSNAGGEMLCFNRDEIPPHKVYFLPFLGDLSDAFIVADNFLEFVRLMGIAWNE